METDSTVDDSQIAKKALYKSFVPEILLRKVWRYAARKTPYMVNLMQPPHVRTAS